MKHLLILLTLLLVTTKLTSAATWVLFDDSEFEADLVKFDYETKNLTFQSDDDTETTYNTRDLAFTSRRKLLFTKEFYQGYSDVDATLWPAGKFWLFLLIAISPVVFLIVGMWVAGIFFAKKFNPFKAIGAFIGSYLTGIGLLLCYFIFSERMNSQMFIWVGGLVACIAMSFFIASIYDANVIRGFLILVFHFVFAALIAFIIVFSAEYLFPVDQVSAVWDKYIFSKVGLLEGPSRTGY